MKNFSNFQSWFSLKKFVAQKFAHFDILMLSTQSAKVHGRFLKEIYLK